MATRMAWLLSGAGRIPSMRANCSAASNTLVCSTAAGLHQAVVVELGQDGAHAVVAQAARVVGRWG